MTRHGVGRCGDWRVTIGLDLLEIDRLERALARRPALGRAAVHRRRARLRGARGRARPAPGRPLLRQGGGGQGARASTCCARARSRSSARAAGRRASACTARWQRARAALGVRSHVSLTHTSRTGRRGGGAAVTLPAWLDAAARRRAHARRPTAGRSRSSASPRSSSWSAPAAGWRAWSTRSPPTARSPSSAARATTAATATSPRGCCARPGREVASSPSRPSSELSGDARANAERLPGEPPQPFAAGAPRALRGRRRRAARHRASRRAARPRRRRDRGARTPPGSPSSPPTCPAASTPSTGEVAGRARSAPRATATFHAAKPGLWIDPGKAARRPGRAWSTSASRPARRSAARRRR